MDFSPESMIDWGNFRLAIELITRKYFHLCHHKTLDLMELKSNQVLGVFEVIGLCLVQLSDPIVKEGISRACFEEISQPFKTFRC